MFRWLRLAAKVARKGKHSQHLVGAVVVNKNRILGCGANLSRPYLEHIRRRGFHAEERALRNANDAEGATIIIVRLNHNYGISGMSRPCDRCMELIKEKKIKTIIYVGADRQPQMERVSYGSI